MAFLSAQTSNNGNGNHVSASITYSTSSNAASHTLSVTNLSVSMSGNTANYPFADVTVTVTFGSDTIYTNTVRVSPTSSQSLTLSVSKATSLAHNATTKALKLNISAVTSWLDSKSHSANLNASGSDNVSIPVRTSYAVTYDANGGSSAPSAQVKWYDEALTLQSGKPTRAGYTFKRWNTNTSDTGTAYNPSAKYEANAALALHAIWNPTIAYDANGGTGAPAAQTKTFGEALTLQVGTPTRTGYAFLRWNTAKNGTGTNYSSGGTMAAGLNDAVTLYAQWQKQPDAPTISSLTVVRSNSSGNASDNGTYCKVTAKWSIDTTNVSGNTATVTGTIAPEGGSASAFSFSSGASGTSGTAVALIPNCDVDTQYAVTVTVTDTRTSTERTAMMTRASAILDLKAGGKAMGIGSTAPDSGLGVGWPTQFDQAVGMLMGLAVGGDLTVLGSIVTDQLKVFSVTSDVATASSGWVVKTQAAYTYGNVVTVTVTLSPSADVAENTSRGICTLNSAYRPRNAHGFADASGIGTVSSGGSCTYRNVVALTTSSTVTVGLTFLK